MSESSADSWVVYLIRTTSGKIYAGITNDLERRFEAHKSHQKGARFFRMSSAEQIVFCEYHPNRSEATKREIAIKKMTRIEKLTLIKSPQNKMTITESESGK